MFDDDDYMHLNEMMCRALEWYWKATPDERMEADLDFQNWIAKNYQKYKGNITEIYLNWMIKKYFPEHDIKISLKGDTEP